MPMFDDPKKELQRLEKQLLKEEEWMDEEISSAKRMLGDAQPQRNMDATQIYRPVADPQVRNYANGYGAAAAKPAPAPETPEAPAEKPLTGLVILACLETLGIVAVVAYWLLHLL